MFYCVPKNCDLNMAHWLLNGHFYIKGYFKSWRNTIKVKYKKLTIEQQFYDGAFKLASQYCHVNVGLWLLCVNSEINLLFIDPNFITKVSNFSLLYCLYQKQMLLFLK